MPNRFAILACLALAAPFTLSACATPQGANAYVDRPWAQSQAQLRELRSAEARVRLVRTKIDFNDEADAGDARELLAAREDLRRLRSQWPSVSTDSDPAYNPLAIPGYLGRGWGRRGYGGVLGINGEAVPETSFTQERLSGLP